MTSGEFYISMINDLTIGKPSKILWRFCLPLIGSVIFQQLYNMTDSIIAGRFISENALAAVGNSYEITLILIAFATGCNVGCAVCAGHSFGAKKYTELKTGIYTALITGAIICSILMILGLTCSSSLLKAIKTPQSIINDSKAYLDIYIIGLPFVFFYNISTGIFTALGDSKTPFFFLVASSTANIGMDILFVKCFNMGVPGVAWATFICQGISCILALTFILIRISKLKGETKAKVYDLKALRSFLYVAIPSTLQQSFVSVGNIIVQSVINSFGTNAIAGYAAAIKLHSLGLSSLITLGNGMSNFTAQNIGAKRYDRLPLGFKSVYMIMVAITIPIALIYSFAGEYIARLFITNYTGDAMKIAVMFLRIVSPFYFVLAGKLVADAVLRGAKKMGLFMATTFTDLVLRVVLSIFLARTKLETNGIWLSWPIGWIIASTMSLIFYAKFIKGINKQNQPVLDCTT